jgi:hypothetical protein
LTPRLWARRQVLARQRTVRIRWRQEDFTRRRIDPIVRAETGLMPALDSSREKHGS